MKRLEHSASTTHLDRMLVLIVSLLCVLPTAFSVPDKSKWIGPSDPSSFSNPEDFLTQNLAINWNVDFDSKTVSGSVAYDVLILNTNVSELIFDTVALILEKVVSDGKELKYHLGPDVGPFGSPLKINVESLMKNKQKGDQIHLEIHYKTGKNCTSLTWVDPISTLGKKQPFVFSSNQPTNARALLPCQDTPSVKATFSSQVSVPKQLRCLMGALSVGEPEEQEPLKIFRFSQKIPISSYLIAITVGDLVSKEIGPRSHVWAEPSFVDEAAAEFSDTEKMLQTAEKLFGNYVWSVYDIVIMPKNYPSLGMENPCLTFVPPFIVAGDKSMIYVISHEISHSWTGNLVTNHDWQHFWLNEGFTKFLERKILGQLHGEEFRHLLSIVGLDKLASVIKNRGEDDPFTSLVMDLGGIDPDETKSSVPYEKGATFLYFLEEKVGGASVFDKFLYQYIQKNSYGSLDSSQFKEQFLAYFNAKGMGEMLQGIEWDRWLYSPGMPPVIPKYDRKLVEPCTKLKNRWVDWNPELEEQVPFNKTDLEGLNTLQIAQFLEELMNTGPQPVKKLEKIEEIYEISKKKSVYIKLRWIRMGVKSRWYAILQPAFDFVNEYGQVLTLRPVYKELNKWVEVREQVIKNFRENEAFMNSVSCDRLGFELGEGFLININYFPNRINPSLNDYIYKQGQQTFQKRNLLSTRGCHKIEACNIVKSKFKTDYNMVAPVAINPRRGRRSAVSAKTAKRTVFLFYSIFGCALIVTCALTNIILLLVVHGSITVADTINRQQGTLKSDEVDPKLALPTHYLLLTWMFNFFASLVTVPLLYSALERLSKLMAKRRVFSQDAPITPFLEIITTFAFSLFLYSALVHAGAALFVRDIFRLINMHMIKKSAPLLVVVTDGNPPDVINV
ncbi:Leukotriene A-4 hydrolase [Orchesella cincta]|uniref:Leukotriene A-4 hydrolase n=1 Tax=Orchesella cincta TaxID=48709 RepID=A0A1D2ME90_ORCCI|nr:Leukotriene A-4 hydrolase [Orchesella cincta]